MVTGRPGLPTSCRRPRQRTAAARATGGRGPARIRSVQAAHESPPNAAAGGHPGPRTDPRSPDPQLEGLAAVERARLIRRPGAELGIARSAGEISVRLVSDTRSTGPSMRTWRRSVFQWNSRAASGSRKLRRPCCSAHWCKRRSRPGHAPSAAPCERRSAICIGGRKGHCLGIVRLGCTRLGEP